MDHRKRAAKIGEAVQGYELNGQAGWLQALICVAFNDAGPIGNSVNSAFCTTGQVQTELLQLLADNVEESGGDLSKTEMFVLIAGDAAHKDYLNRLEVILPAKADLNMFQRIKKAKLKGDLGM